MKQARLFMGMVLLAMLILSPNAQAVEKKATSGLPSWYAMLANDAKLSPEQIAQLKEAYNEQKNAKADWKAQYADAYKSMKEAKSSGDDAAYKQAKEKYKEGLANKKQIESTFDGKLETILNDEQKGIYSGMSLYMGSAMSFSKVGLTDEQKAKIKQMAYAEGSKSVGLKGKELHQAKAAFKEKVISEVLTAEQRETLGKKGKGKPEKTAKPKKEKKDKD